MADSLSRIAGLETELEIISASRSPGGDATEREAAARAKLDSEHKRLADLELRWKAEKTWSISVLDIRKDASWPRRAGRGYGQQAGEARGGFAEKNAIAGW